MRGTTANRPHLKVNRSPLANPQIANAICNLLAKKVATTANTIADLYLQCKCGATKMLPK
jgi:hypothetical protein